MAKKSSKTRAKSARKKTAFSTRQFVLYILVFALVGAFTLWISLAAPHNGGGGGKVSYTGSFVGTNPVMVTDNNGDGLPNYGDTITFKVTSTAGYPMVRLLCTSGGATVDDQNVGFYPGWVWSQNYQLSHWYYWPNDSAADCTATLYYQGTKGNVTLATMSFHVNA
jgi:hypothetical protein